MTHIDKRISGKHSFGQSMVEFALILPIFVLFIIGIFDLGRAFFAYIAIANAAREGTRVFTFSPDKTKYSDIQEAITFEVGASSVVNSALIARQIQCGDTVTDIFNPVTNDTTLTSNCLSGETIKVTLTYPHELILSFFFPGGITLKQSAEMLIP